MNGFTHRLVVEDAPGPEPGTMVRYGRTNGNLSRAEYLRAEVFALRSAGCYGVIDLTVKAGDADPVLNSIDLPTEVLRGLALSVLLADQGLLAAVVAVASQGHTAEVIRDALGAMAAGQEVQNASHL